MAGITLAEAQAKLAAWMTAEEALMSAQEYSMPGGRRMRKADLEQIRETIDYWDKKVKQLSRGRKIWGVTPC